MRIIIQQAFLLSFILYGMSAYGQDQNYALKLTVTDSNDTIAYLGHHYGDKRFVDDTARIENSTALFTGNKELKEGLYFYYSGTDYFEFILDNDKDFAIETSKGDFVKNMKITGSDQNTTFQKMQVFVTERKARLGELNSKLNSTTDSAEIKSVNEKISLLDEEVRSYQKSVAENNEGMLVSRMMYAVQTLEVPDNIDELSDIEKYQYYKDNFFKNFDVADDGLLRTPLYHPKIIEYLDKVIIPHPDTVIVEIDRLMKQVEDNEDVYRYLVVTLASKYENSPVMGYDEVFVSIVDKYYLNNTPEWLDPEVKKNLEDRVATMRYSFIGMEAPKLVLNDTSMNNVSLYGIEADYTVLYFYDPDCGHCKKKTPVMIEAYNRLKNDNQNVEFLGINITNNQERWKQYINEVDLNWINLADNFNRTNFKYFYDIRSTPTIYILDKDKKIVAKKLDAIQVEEFIKKSEEAVEASSSGR